MHDVTLALVNANILSCWESKVKLGFECFLFLKHSKGKSTTTLQFSTANKPYFVPQAEKKTKNGQTKKIRGSKQKLEVLLLYQQRLMKEKGLPPAGLCYIMLLWNPPPLDLFQSLAMSAERNSSVNNVTFLLNQIVV